MAGGHEPVMEPLRSVSVPETYSLMTQSSVDSDDLVVAS